mmetsp:Transcript_109965/g.355097  ORF Transcript_109965/g.355097 Transcript_109965/m.355097 type:complete len:246 (+) Transcript_109965:927-1664(+)
MGTPQPLRGTGAPQPLQRVGTVVLLGPPQQAPPVLQSLGLPGTPALTEPQRPLWPGGAPALLCAAGLAQPRQTLWLLAPPWRWLPPRSPRPSEPREAAGRPRPVGPAWLLWKRGPPGPPSGLRSAGPSRPLWPWRPRRLPSLLRLLGLGLLLRPPDPLQPPGRLGLARLERLLRSLELLGPLAWSLLLPAPPEPLGHLPLAGPQWRQPGSLEPLKWLPPRPGPREPPGSPRLAPSVQPLELGLPG